MSWWKVQVNVVTPQELGVCGESNEIHVNGEKRKKLFGFDKVIKKCMFKLAVKKKFYHKEKPYPQHIKWSARLRPTYFPLGHMPTLSNSYSPISCSRF